MTCKNGSCEYQNGMKRDVKVTKDEKRYAQLWSEIELPKLLRSLPE